MAAPTDRRGVKIVVARKPPGKAEWLTRASAMTGWRLVGIIASVISFFGFGVYLSNQSVEDAVAPYAQDLRICSALEQYSDKFWQENARDPEELSEKLQVNQDQYEKCALKAKLQWESERSSDSVLAIVALVIDLGTIVLGWLIVWGCVVLGRWLRRRFASN
jgi:hypothetical protein